MRIEVLLDLKTRLGESPVWDVEQQRLWWVDSLDGRLFACNAQGGAIKSWDVRQKIGSFALRQNGEGAVVALQNGVHLLDFASGELTLLHIRKRTGPLTGSTTAKSIVRDVFCSDRWICVKRSRAARYIAWTPICHCTC
ncbi:hypothetical protein THOKLE011_08870 [Klebsiella michiganensis]|nr:hypothetical protein THOKLE011_08870 [Klebsiella michiganensis]